MLVIRSEKKLQRIKLNSKHNKNILTNIQQSKEYGLCGQAFRHFKLCPDIQFTSSSNGNIKPRCLVSLSPEAPMQSPQQQLH